MKTKLLLAQNPADLMIAVEILKNGGIVALATETVYGLAAHAYNTEAIERVFKAKNRPNNNPLIVHVRNIDCAYELFDWSNMDENTKGRFFKLAQHFWPGPLSLVARSKDLVPFAARGGLSSVAVRIPKAQSCLSILEMTDFPLVMPSANISTRPSPTCAEHVLKTLDNRIDAVLDAGTCLLGIESSVVRIDGEQACLLRFGSISAQEISSVLGENLLIPAPADKPQAPGQAYLHYAPQVSQLRVVDSVELEALWLDFNSIIGRKKDLDKLYQKLGPRNQECLSLSLGDEPKSFAAKLYQALYRCEERPCAPVLILRPPKEPEWAAVIDRIRRASGT